MKKHLEKLISTVKGRIALAATAAVVAIGGIAIVSSNNGTDNSNSDSRYEQSYLDEDDRETEVEESETPEESEVTVETTTSPAGPEATVVPNNFIEDEPAESEKPATRKPKNTNKPAEPTETLKPIEELIVNTQNPVDSKPVPTQAPIIIKPTETHKPVSPSKTPAATVKPTSTPIPVVTPSPSPEPSEEPTPSPTPSPTPTPKPSEEPTPSPTPSPTPTPEPSEEPTPSPTPSPTPEPTETPTVEPTETQSPTPIISTGKVQVGQSFWDTFLEVITFGIYQPKNVEVTITSSNDDDIIEYYVYESDSVTGSGLKVEELEGKEFSKYNDSAKPVLDKEANVVVYVRITSSTGNVTYISTDGMIVNENGVAPTPEPTPTVTPSPEPSEEPTPSPTPSPTPTPEPSEEPTPSPTPSPTPTPEPSEEPTPSPTPSSTPTPEPSEEPTQTPKPTYTLVIECSTGGSVELDGNSVEFSNNSAEKVVELGNYTLKAIPAEGYKFIGWEDALNRVVSTEIEYTISVAGTTTISAKFAEIQTTVNVSYCHENGEVILHEAVKFGETLTPPTSNVWRSDKTFAGWKIAGILYEGSYENAEFYSASGEALSVAIKNLTSAKQDVEIISYYVANPITYYNVSVSGGAITVSGEAVSPGAIEAGTKIVVTANVPEGYVFNYWTDGNGDIITYDTIYSIVVKTDMSLIAVYSEIPVEKEPLVYFFGDKYVVDVSNSAITFYMSCDIPPEKYTKEEWGFLYSTKLEDDQMVLGANIGKVTDNLEESKNAPKVNYTFDATFSPSVFSNHKLIKVRVYAVLEDTSTGEDVIIYSDVLKIQL